MSEGDAGIVPPIVAWRKLPGPSLNTGASQSFRGTRDGPLPDVLGLSPGFAACCGGGGGIIVDIVLGMVGAVVGGFIASALGMGDVTGINVSSIVIATIGAIRDVVLRADAPSIDFGPAGAGVPGARLPGALGR